MGVEDVLDIAGEDEADIRFGRLGEGRDETKQVLVRAQSTDVEQETLIGDEGRAVRGRPPTRVRGTAGRRSGPGLP